MEKQNIQSKITSITKSIEFSSAHYYYVENWTDSQNKARFGLCSNKDSHGHNYVLHVRLKAEPDKYTGMIINLIDLKKILKEKVLKAFDHKNLNLDTPYFKTLLPTTENLCKIIWNLLQQDLSDKLDRVLIYELDNFYAYYKGVNNMFYITRIYTFSASHRLHNEKLTEEENRKVFDKCNNYNAHGHNFKLEVTIKGPLDPVTGMVYDLVEMDKIINEQIIMKLDHKNLHANVEELKGMVTTGENLTRYIWDKIDNQFLPAKLHKIKLFETDRNYFEYKGGK